MSEFAEKVVCDLISDFVRLMNERDFPEVMDMMSDDIVIVRPSGNPLTKEGWGNMLTSEDVETKGAKLLDIHVVKGSEVGDMCYACYTTHSRFNYKGIENDDIAVFVVIFRKGMDNKWKMHYMQRSTGRKPSEPLPKFN
tara:strand:- start:11375 stop:11791 length:417 start_codon:yes stop_codon:yes gene_type:complete